jgi:hypothetical protein
VSGRIRVFAVYSRSSLGLPDDAPSGLNATPSTIFLAGDHLRVDLVQYCDRVTRLLRESRPTPNRKTDPYGGIASADRSTNTCR